MKGIREKGVVFRCGEEDLVGVLSSPHPGETRGSMGVVVVVGGAQYRVGSHRQFVFLARSLARRGIPCMRFDVRGMGDSTGRHPGFEGMFDDIGAALDSFLEHMPSVRGVVLWGLCDGATASCLYAPTDRRVAGLVLLNPWVRTEQGEAVTLVRRYYLRRVFDPDWWRRARDGEWRPLETLRGIGRAIRAIVLGRRTSGEQVRPLSERLAEGIERSGVPFSLVLSGNDLVALEFMDHALATAAWRRLTTTRLVSREDIVEADHTFSASRWRHRVEEVTASFVEAVEVGGVPVPSLGVTDPGALPGRPPGHPHPPPGGGHRDASALRVGPAAGPPPRGGAPRG